MKDLIHGKPIKVILLFALPLYIGQLFQLIYGVVDTRIIGSVLGEQSLAAVGTTTALSDLVMEFLNGVVCGFGIIVATFFGAKEEENMKKTIGGTIAMGIGFTILISIGCIAFLPQILSLLNISDALRPEATAYIMIILAGLTITTLYNICAAVLRAIGDSFTVLIFLIIANLLNVILDYLFVMYLGMGVQGAAIGTVLSQMVSVLLCLLFMIKKYPVLLPKARDFIPDKTIYKQLIPTGLSMGFMLSFVLIGSLVLQTSINTFGTNIIVAHTAARKVTIIFLTPFFVLGAALATYCGQNLGAKEYQRIKEGIKSTILLSVAWCAIALLLTFCGSRIFIQLITASNEEEILKMAVLYLKINACFYILPAIICILRNSMQGFGDTRTPLISSFIELAGKVLIAFLLAPIIGYLGIIISEPIVWMVMVVPLLWGMKKFTILSKKE